MGILSMGSTVLTMFRADTKQHRQQLKLLSGEEKKRHGAIISQLDQQNSKLDSYGAKLTQVAKVTAALGAAFFALQKSFEIYSERQRYYAAGAGSDIANLSKAIHGLVSKTQLLKVEAQLLNSPLGMNQEQIRLALKWTLALHKKGFGPLKDILEKVTRAFIEINTEPLKEFSVNLSVASGTLKGFREIIAYARKDIQFFGGDLEIAGENNLRAQTALKDSTDDLADAWGEFASEILPVVIDGLGGLLNMFTALTLVIKSTWKWIKETSETPIMKAVLWPVNKAAQGYKKMYQWGDYGLNQMWAAMGLDEQKVKMKPKRRTWKMKHAQLPQYTDPYKPFYGQKVLRPLKSISMGKGLGTFKYFADASGKEVKTDKRGRRTAYYYGPDGTFVDPENWNPMKKPKGGRGAQKVWFGEQANVAREYPGVSIPTDISGFGPGEQFGIKSIFKTDEEREAWEKQTALAGRSRPAEAMDATEKFLTSLHKLEALKTVLGGVEEAAGTMFGTFISGGDGAAEAFRKSLASMMQGIAISEGIETMRALSFMFANLAWGDARGASLWGIAAAKHAATATAAGIATVALGGTGGGAAPNVAGSTGRTGGRQSSQTIILGADFETDSSRRRSHRLASILEQANMSGASDTVIEWS